MPIHLITGLPGNGKTAIMMEHMHQQATAASRPLFAFGIDGLAPGMATVLDDPKKWNDKDEQGEYLIPNGSLIYIDEAWKWFGHLHDASRQATPKHVLDLAEHRHRGLDFVWTTQTPGQIYPFARALIADHWHAVRRFGTRMLDLYKWGELCDDVKSQSKRELAVKQTRTLPAMEILNSYQSATQHTIKAKIPLRIWLLPAIFLAGIGMAFMAYSYLTPESMAAKIVPASQGAQSGLPDAQPKSANTLQPTDLAQLLYRQTPLIPAQPWTAPHFGDVDPQTKPMIYCMAGDLDGINPSCNCLTEQGTKYYLEMQQCILIAKNGLYNPNKEKARESSPAKVAFDSRSDMFIPLSAIPD